MEGWNCGGGCGVDVGVCCASMKYVSAYKSTVIGHHV